MDLRVTLHAKDYETGQTSQALAEALRVWRDHGQGQALISQLARNTGTSISEWTIDITPIPSSITMTRKSRKEIEDATAKFRKERAQRLVAQRQQEDARKLHQLREERKAHEDPNPSYSQLGASSDEVAG